MLTIGQIINEKGTQMLGFDFARMILMVFYVTALATFRQSIWIIAILFCDLMIVAIMDTTPQFNVINCYFINYVFQMILVQNITGRFTPYKQDGVICCLLSFLTTIYRNETSTPVWIATSVVMPVLLYFRDTIGHALDPPIERLPAARTPTPQANQIRDSNHSPDRTRNWNH